MPQVDFYILDPHRHPVQLVCQLVDKAYQQGLKVQIHTCDQIIAQAIDDRLWTFSDISFIPHAMYQRGVPAETQVLISWQDHPQSHTGVLMNLTTNMPDAVENFARIIEIVAADDESRQYARQRYRDYRDLGCDLETHNIG